MAASKIDTIFGLFDFIAIGFGILNEIFFINSGEFLTNSPHEFLFFPRFQSLSISQYRNDLA